jgi:hypothetical protein
LVENLCATGVGELEQIWGRIQAQNIQVLTWDDEEYSGRLKDTEQPRLSCTSAAI